MVEQEEGIKLNSGSNNKYPAPLAKYEDVVANRQLFLTTLEKLHAAMGTKFMVPIIGGRDLDLHKLFLEVTSRGGIEKILREKRWKDVTATFNFPSTATNASFVLRKYYYSLLQHYERIYYFKAQGWTPSPNGVLQSPNTTSARVHGLPIMSGAPTQVEGVQQPRINSIEFASGGDGTAPTVGSPVIGVIDGKFESGYLVTVTIGEEKLKGVLYQAPATPNPMNQTERAPTTCVHRKRRRRRRRKSEIRKRDPAHPKPNRSGYNFFFAEQHARLKPLYPGKDREISRMIGELWNKLKDNEKAIYQEKAIRDKERYRMEMEDYRERIRGSQVISDAVPIQQKHPHLSVEGDAKEGRGRGTAREYPPVENESNSSKSDSEEDEEEEEEEEEDDDDDYENLSEAEASLAVAANSACVGASATATGDFREDDKGCQQSQGGLGLHQNQPQHHNSITSIT